MSAHAKVRSNTLLVSLLKPTVRKVPFMALTPRSTCAPRRRLSACPLHREGTLMRGQPVAVGRADTHITWQPGSQKVRAEPRPRL